MENPFEKFSSKETPAQEDHSKLREYTCDGLVSIHKIIKEMPEYDSDSLDFEDLLINPKLQQQCIIDVLSKIEYLCASARAHLEETGTDEVEAMAVAAQAVTDFLGPILGSNARRVLDFVKAVKIATAKIKKREQLVDVVSEMLIMYAKANLE